MGLDSVEMVLRVEDEFKIRIQDADAERLQTVGQLVRHVQDAVLGARPSIVCESAACFYAFRRVLIEELSIARSAVSPQTQLLAVVPVEDRRRVWDALDQAGLPLYRLQLVQTTWQRVFAIAVVLSIVVGLPFIVGYFYQSVFGAPSAKWTINSAFAIEILLAILFYQRLDHWLEPRRTRMENPGITVRELIQDHVLPNWRLPARGNRAVLEPLIRDRVRMVISDELSIPVEELRDGDRFVDDLGVD